MAPNGHVAVGPHVPTHIPRPACSASRCAALYFRFEYSGQSRASPLRTSQSARLTRPTEHVATVRPYRSTLTGRQFTGRSAMKASRSLTALAPHRYCKLSSPRQSWPLSGASMPHSRMRVPWISNVSPSIMLACPAISSGKAKAVDARKTQAVSAFVKSLKRTVGYLACT